MDWKRIEQHRAFPNLPLEDFDRYPHHFRREPRVQWKALSFPFSVHSLPRLPKLNTARYRLLSRTHHTLSDVYETEVDPERESYNFLETIGDGVLRFYATRAIVKHGCAPVGEDVHTIRELLTNNTTLSYVAQAYRLDHTARHLLELAYPPQKMMADLFEAYGLPLVGAAWMEAEDAGDVKLMEKWLDTFFDPSIWDDWTSLQQDLAAKGKEKRLRRIEHTKKRNLGKQMALEKRLDRAAKKRKIDQDIDTYSPSSS